MEYVALSTFRVCRSEPSELSPAHGLHVADLNFHPALLEFSGRLPRHCGLRNINITYSLHNRGILSKFICLRHNFTKKFELTRNLSVWTSVVLVCTCNMKVNSKKR